MDFGRTFSYRYASCREPAVGFSDFEVGFAVDCKLDDPDFDLDWDFWTGYFNTTFWMVMGNVPFLAEMGAHELRSTPGPGGWMIEREEGTRADIVLWNPQGTFEELAADGSHNREPDFLVLDERVGTGLLAYQSDLCGSFDVYVRNTGGGGMVRVTRGEGWEGSPAWVPLP
jgi:hypothetical protein